MATNTIPQYQRENIAQQISNAVQMLALVSQNKGVTELALILERDRNKAAEVVRLQAQKADEDQKIAALILKIEELTTTLAHS